jgi:hypothetical protein
MQLLPRVNTCTPVRPYELMCTPQNYTFPHTKIKHMYIAQCIPDMYIIPDMGGG